MKDPQHAADVADIAKLVETMGKLIDNFRSAHGEEIYERLATAWPAVELFGGKAPNPLYRLKRDLTSPDER